MLEAHAMMIKINKKSLLNQEAGTHDNTALYKLKPSMRTEIKLFNWCWAVWWLKKEDTRYLI